MEGFRNVQSVPTTCLSRVQQDLDKLRTSIAVGSESSNDMLRTAAAKSGQISVAIIGAGFAGLRCADILLQHGVKVTIFEARNRIGGRVAQSNHLGHVVDLGPNWIHGTNDNPMIKLAQETNTQLHSWDEVQTVFDSEGEPLDTEEAIEFTRLIWDDGVVGAAFKYSNDHGASIPTSMSLYDFFVERAKTFFTDLPESVAVKKRAKFLQTASMWGAYVGSATEKQSLKFFWMEECIEGENPFVAGTYTKILEAVAKPAKQNANIMLETRVVGVHADEKSGDNHSRSIVETADGTKTAFDEIVVTSPLGWLQRNTDMFHPPLENRLAQAISNIGYGSLDKIYVTFPSAFWNSPTGKRASNGIDPDHTTPNVTATTIPLHQPSQKSGESEAEQYPGMMHWLPPSYATSTNPGHWDQQAMNLAALPAPSAHPTLLFYIYGDCATHIAKLVQTTPAADLDTALIAFAKPYFSRLPNYSSSEPECKPSAVLATAWAGDELAGYGSYSNFQVGLEEGDKDVETMRHGMPERGVWFAGEHTAPFIALGTSTGAYWAGEAVGERIVKAYQLGKTET